MDDGGNAKEAEWWKKKKEMFHSSNEMAFLYGRLIKRQISHESFRARSIHACQTTRRALDL